MARPKGTPKQRLIVWLPPAVADRIVERAEAKDQTPSEWAARVLSAQFPETPAAPTIVGRAHAPTCACPLCKPKG